MTRRTWTSLRALDLALDVSSPSVNTGTHRVIESVMFVSFCDLRSRWFPSGKQIVIGKRETVYHVGTQLLKGGEPGSCIYVT